MLSTEDSKLKPCNLTTIYVMYRPWHQYSSLSRLRRNVYLLIMFWSCFFFFSGWMGSLLLSLACLSSPISSHLIHRRSPRYIAILGVLLCGLATLISSYIRDFFGLYITFSIFYGIGANFVYQSTSMLMLMESGSESSVKASGIALTGTTLGEKWIFYEILLLNYTKLCNMRRV